MSSLIKYFPKGQNDIKRVYLAQRKGKRCRCGVSGCPICHPADSHQLKRRLFCHWSLRERCWNEPSRDESLLLFYFFHFPLDNGEGKKKIPKADRCFSNDSRCFWREDVFKWREDKWGKERPSDRWRNTPVDKWNCFHGTILWNIVSTVKSARTDHQW